MIMGPEFCERYFVGKRMTRNGHKMVELKSSIFWIETEYKSGYEELTNSDYVNKAEKDFYLP